MHFRKFSLHFFTSVMLTLSSFAQTPTIIASTNYVCANGSLHISGYGFMGLDYVKVFVDDYRAPKFAFYTDANGCFDMDLTYGGPYRIPDVQYRFSNSSYVEPSVTVHYQNAEMPPCISGFIHMTRSNVGSTGGTPIVEINISALVGRGGNCYDVLSAPSPLGPWKSMGMVRTNDTWESQSFLWNFRTADETCAYFQVIGIDCSKQ